MTTTPPETYAPLPGTRLGQVTARAALGITENESGELWLNNPRSCPHCGADWAVHVQPTPRTNTKLFSFRPARCCADRHLETAKRLRAILNGKKKQLEHAIREGRQNNRPLLEYIDDLEADIAAEIAIAKRLPRAGTTPNAGGQR